MAGLDKNTKLLLHCDGTDASTSFPDVSDSNHTVTAGGTAQVDTAQSKWGGASCLLDGDSDYLSLPDHADWDICSSAADDWTIDFWVKMDTFTGSPYFIDQYEDTNNRWLIYYSPGIRFLLVSGGSTIIDTGDGDTISDTNWHHIALCKVASKYAIYLDGQQGNYTDDSSTDTLAGVLEIGRYGAGSSYLDGYMDEIRIQHSNYFGAAPVVGETDTITVPAGPYNKAGGAFLFNLV